MLDNPLVDHQALSSLTGLAKLGFHSGFRDVSFVGALTQLEELRIDACRQLPQELAQLQNLKVFCSLGGELSDISILAQIPSLTAVDISWNLVEDIAPLASLPLTELYLQGNPVTDYTPIKDLYPKLLGKNFEYIELRQPENPDAVVTFADPVLEQKIRAAMGKPDGEITAGEAAMVTSLNISNQWQPQIPQEVMVTGLQGMEAFLSLRDLDAGFNSIGDLSPLSTLTELRSLNFGGNNLIRDIRPLSGLTNLESLTLFDGGIRDLSPLSGLTKLSFLNLANNPLGDISPLAGLTLIDYLYLSSCEIDDIGPLAGMTHLVLLNLSNNPIADYTPIEKIYPQLEEKDFELGQVFDIQAPLKPENPEQPVPITDAALEAILREVAGVHDRPLTYRDTYRIREIQGGVEQMWPEVADLTALSACANLERLNIFVSKVSDLTPLSGLGRLTVLAITDSRVSDLTPLSGMTQLEYLELPGNQITDVTPLKALADLHFLDVSRNRITDMSPLYGLKNLNILFVNYNLTTDAGGFKDMMQNMKKGGTDFDPDKPLEMYREPAENGQPEGEPEGQADTSGIPDDFLYPEKPDKVIKFADKVMERRVREAMNRPEGPITALDAAQVDFLNLGNEWQEKFPKGSQITKLDGIEYFINLRSLDISWNKIKDIKKLAGLTQLNHLRAFSNAISDLKPLARLTNLITLNVGANKIKSIKPLSGLANLTELLLSENPIKDFSPVAEIYPRLTGKDFEIK